MGVLADWDDIKRGRIPPLIQVSLPSCDRDPQPTIFETSERRVRANRAALGSASREQCAGVYRE